MKTGFLGTGTITSAMVTGLCTGGGERAILVSPRNAAVAAGLAERFPQVAVASSNQQVLDECETVVLAVRPQVVEEVLAELHFRAGQHVISVVSGFPVWRISGMVAPAGKVTRAVPLPFAARRRCPTAIYPHDRETFEFFAPLGEAFELDTEAELAAMATATATMASYFAFAGEIASWLGRNGIPAEQAREYVARVFSALSETAVEAPALSFQTLAVEHATPGGTNQQIRRTLTEQGVFDRLSEALDAVLRRVTAASQQS